MMRRLSNDECFNRLTKSECYINTVSAGDKAKVIKARLGVNPTTPSSRIAQVAAELGLRAHADQSTPAPEPKPEPTPPDPKTIFFPRTFNKEGVSDARYCVSTSSPAYASGSGSRIFDKGGGVYNSDGLCDGGRDPDFIAHKENGEPLRGAKSMDNFGPCDLYDGLTEWPPESYHR